MWVWSICLPVLNVFFRVEITEDEIQQVTGRDGSVQQHKVKHDYIR